MNDMLEQKIFKEFEERDKILDHTMCMPCCDYELCMRDNSRCYQYYEELEMMKRKCTSKRKVYQKNK